LTATPPESSATLRLGHRDRGIALALVLSLLLWQLPYGGVALYPFKLFATWIHEMSHGVTMLATGAGFNSLHIYRDTSGIAHAASGTHQIGRALIASSGYMGASILGAALLVMAQAGRASRVALGLIGAAMATSALIWVDNDFGLLVAWTGAALFCGAAALLPERWAGWALGFVAAQACINAVLDIRVLFRAQLVINGQVVGASDAHKMAESSFGSPTLWAAIWLLWSFALFYVALRLAYLRERRASLSTITS
jgi:hypothetical protein